MRTSPRAVLLFVSAGLLGLVAFVKIGDEDYSGAGRFGLVAAVCLAIGLAIRSWQRRSTRD
jgi:hypothetical protein